MPNLLPLAKLFVRKVFRIEPRTTGLMVYDSCTSFVDQWLVKSPGVLVYKPYSGPATFVARNKVRVPGRPLLALVISFFKYDGKTVVEKFAEVSPLFCMSLGL